MSVRTALYKNQGSRSPKSGPSEIVKLTQLVFEMKPNMGSMSNTIIRSGISFDRSPNEQKLLEQLANGKQKDKFAVTAKKKNRTNKIAQQSLVHVQQKTEGR